MAQPPSRPSFMQGAQTRNSNLLASYLSLEEPQYSYKGRHLYIYTLIQLYTYTLIIVLLSYSQ